MKYKWMDFSGKTAMELVETREDSDGASRDEGRRENTEIVGFQNVGKSVMQLSTLSSYGLWITIDTL
jgi:hypothetical protein